MNRTKIGWCDRSWNPVTGCRHGCPYCYAERIALRFEGDFEPRFRRKRLDQPLSVREPQRVFVCSMADLFGEWVPDEWIARVLEVVRDASWHRFLFLTKNPYRYRYWEWPDNAWLGATATDQASFDEAAWALHDDLEATVRFVSAEPLLEPIELPTFADRWLDWLIIGAQSGPGAPPARVGAARRLTRQAQAQGIPIWHKQTLPPSLSLKEQPSG